MLPSSTSAVLRLCRRTIDYFVPEMPAEDFERRETRRFVAVIVLLEALILAVVLPTQGSTLSRGIVGLLLLINLGLLALLRRGRVDFASIAAPLVGWIGMVALALLGQGVYDAANTALVLPIICAGLLRLRRQVVLLCMASVATLWLQAWCQQRGWIGGPLDSQSHVALDISLAVILAAALIRFYADNLAAYTTRLVVELSERQRAEAMAAESGRDYLEIYNSVQDGIFLHHADSGELLDVNQATETMFGYTREELLGMSVADLSAADEGYDQPQALARLGEAVAGGQSRFEWRSRRRDGSTFWSEVLLSRSQIGGQRRVLAVVRDIDQRKRVEQALRESEERYRSIFENTQDVYYETDLGGRVLEVSPSVEREWGFVRSEVLGRPVSDFYADPSQRQVVVDLITTRGRVTDLELQLRGSDGSIIDCSLSAILTFDEHGRPRKICGSLRDIRERVAAARALQASEERFRSIVDAVPDGITIADSDGHLQHVNAATCRQLGYTEAELLGMTVFEIVPQRFWARAARRLQTMEAQLTPIESANLRSDGTELPTEWLGLPILFGGERCMMAVARDVSERLKAEQALRASETTLRALLDAIPDVAFLMATDGTVIAANASSRERFGLSNEQIVGSIIFDYLDPEVAATRRTWMAEAAATGAPVTFEDERAGRHFETRIFPIAGADGQVDRLAVLGVDITERRRAEQALRDSEEAFRVVFEESPLVLVLQDLEGHVLAINRRAEEITGFAREQVLGRIPREMGMVGDPARAKQMRDRLIRDGELASEEFTVIDVRGNILDGLMSGRLMHLHGEPMTLQVWQDISGIKRAEEALRESEDRFRAAFAASPLGIAIARLEDGVFVDTNAAAVAIYGYGVEEVVGASAFDLDIWVHPEDRAWMLTQLRDEGEVHGKEMRLQRKDGSLFTASVSARPLTLGGVAHVLFVTEDVTERTRAREALQYLSAFEKLVADIAAGFVGSQSDGLESAVTDALRQVALFVQADAGHLFRFSDDGESFSLAHVWQNERLATDPAQMQDVPTSRIPWWHQRLRAGQAVVVPALDDLPVEAGSERQIIGSHGVRSLVDVPIFSQSRLVAFLGFNSREARRDWTADQVELLRFLGSVLISAIEREQAEEAVRQSEATLRAVFEQSPSIIVLMDSDQRFVAVNQAFEEIVGIRAGDAIGQTPMTLGVGFDPVTRDAVRRLLAEKGRVDQLQTTMRRPDQPPFEGLHSARLLDLGGERHTLAQTLDITEQVGAQRALEGAVARLEQANTELERFTYTVSHDLKSPLITITGFIDLLRVDIADGRFERCDSSVERIDNAARHMMGLLNDLLELSRIGRMINPSQSVPFGQLASEVMELLTGTLTERGARVLVQPDLPTVHGDLPRLREVLQNLVENACKFTDRQTDPCIEIGCEGPDAESGQPIFFVRDNGLGFDPSYGERIFGLFDQLDPSRGGTGIGLALVKRIVAQHGGRVWAESHGVGTGATFRFTLPTAARNAPEPSPGGDATSPGPST
jgi:PAS domain S-box-containing protein